VANSVDVTYVGSDNAFNYVYAGTGTPGDVLTLTQTDAHGQNGQPLQDANGNPMTVTVGDSGTWDVQLQVKTASYIGFTSETDGSNALGAARNITKDDTTGSPAIEYMGATTFNDMAARGVSIDRIRSEANEELGTGRATSIDSSKIPDSGYVYTVYNTTGNHGLMGSLLGEMLCTQLGGVLTDPVQAFLLNHSNMLADDYFDMVTPGGQPYDSDAGWSSDNPNDIPPWWGNCALSFAG
jgi:hypothetical protein